MEVSIECFRLFQLSLRGQKIERCHVPYGRVCVRSREKQDRTSSAILSSRWEVCVNRNGVVVTWYWNHFGVCHVECVACEEEV